MKDLLGAALQLRAKYHFYKGLTLRAFLDLNYIKPERNDGFLYPFYDIGLGWEPVKDVSMMISLTNRAMNLDKSYPTYYLYRTPAEAITLRWNIP
jgi:hypothetical protein